MKKNLLLLLLLIASAGAWAQHTISGTITDAKTGETLIGATVYDTISKKGAATNQHGRFTLTLKESKAVLRVSYVGYETQFHPMEIDKNQRLDVQLKGSVTLSEVVITGERVQHVESSQSSIIELPVEQVKSVPVIFGETDVIKVVQLLPGVQSGSEGMSGMYVRGGGPDENLFLLDGVPMYNVNHLGGFFSAFNSDAVKNITLYKGSFPAHFSSRLSSVLDITTNNGNDKEYHGGVGVGLISAKFNLEGPIIKEKTTFSISGRRTYGDALLQPIIALVAATEGMGDEKVNAGYYFYDLNAKITHKFNNRSRLYASYYMGDDALYAKYKYFHNSLEKDFMRLGYNWGNIVGSVRWNYELTPKLFMNVTGAYTRYRNNLALTEESVYLRYTDSYTMGFNSGIQDITARADFDYAPSPDHAVKFGGQVLHHIFKPETSSIKVSENDEEDSYKFDTIIGQSIVHANEMMLYAEDDWRINDWLKVNAGLNMTGFQVQGVFYPSVQPRLSGRILFNDRLSAKVGYAYMTQYLHLLSNSSISLPTDLWVPVTARIKPMTSQQVAAGLFYNVLDLNLSVEGYYKYMDNLLEYKDGASFWGNSQGWEDKVCMGRGWAYGVEFLAQKSVGRLTGWLGYTWSHTDRKFDREGNILNAGRTFPAKYDRRHDVSLVLTYKFNEHIDASASWVFSSGNTATLPMQDIDPSEEGTEQRYPYYYNYEVPYVSSRNNYRMPNYHRMDVSVNFHKKLRRGKRTINISIYNVYNHQNPYLVYESYAYDFRTGNDTRVLKQLSIFPILPSISYNWTF
ncbi:MAG: TonB-dependent receptor [Bacteroidales bacterium]|nr:TonB-dependent receptor [Bacteroidales bacterium]